MLNKYEQLVRDLGEEAAKDYMRQMSLKRTKPSRKAGKVASDITKRGWETRRQNANKKTSQSQDWPKRSDFAQS